MRGCDADANARRDSHFFRAYGGELIHRYLA
jgi:hypothetical protein